MNSGTKWNDETLNNLVGCEIHRSIKSINLRTCICHFDDTIKLLLLRLYIKLFNVLHYSIFALIPHYYFFAFLLFFILLSGAINRTRVYQKVYWKREDGEA